MRAEEWTMKVKFSRSPLRSEANATTSGFNLLRALELYGARSSSIVDSICKTRAGPEHPGSG